MTRYPAKNLSSTQCDTMKCNTKKTLNLTIHTLSDLYVQNVTKCAESTFAQYPYNTEVNLTTHVLEFFTSIKRCRFWVEQAYWEHRSQSSFRSLCLLSNLTVSPFKPRQQGDVTPNGFRLAEPPKYKTINEREFTNTKRRRGQKYNTRVQLTERWKRTKAANIYLLSERYCWESAK